MKASLPKCPKSSGGHFLIDRCRTLYRLDENAQGEMLFLRVDITSKSIAVGNFIEAFFVEITYKRETICFSVLMFF